MSCLVKKRQRRSLNGERIAAATGQGVVYCFEVKTGKRLKLSKEKVQRLTRLTVTNDGRYTSDAGVLIDGLLER